MIRLVPVFVIKTPPKAEQNPVDVMLMGIFWKAVEGDDNTWIVSPIRNVEMPRTELGPSRICDSARRMLGPLGRSRSPMAETQLCRRHTTLSRLGIGWSTIDCSQRNRS